MNKVRVKYSDDKKFYYLPDFFPDGKFWLSTEVIDGPVPEEKKKGNYFNCWIEIKVNDGRIYHREQLPFVFFDLKRRLQIEEELDKNDDRVLDYLSLIKNVKF